MIYGLYLSAAGILANSYRQDVIANNLANSETVGFKRDLALFHERSTALQERGKAGDWSDPLLEHLGGGLLASPTSVDTTQGDLQQTGNGLDVAIEGNGYFAVSDGKKDFLTRDGQFAINQAGELILSNSRGQRVLDKNRQPIRLGTGPISIARDGVLTQAGKPLAQIGLFDVADPTQLSKEGGTMLSYKGDLKPATGVLRDEFIERANVEPTSELAALMDTQRQLEANANMIRYQDQMLQRLVNDVGKIS